MLVCVDYKKSMSLMTKIAFPFLLDKKLLYGFKVYSKIEPNRLPSFKSLILIAAKLIYFLSVSSAFSAIHTVLLG